jgi:hypothetical protein
MNSELLILAARPAYASRARPELSSLHFETRPFRTVTAWNILPIERHTVKQLNLQRVHNVHGRRYQLQDQLQGAKAAQ